MGNRDIRAVRASCSGVLKVIVVAKFIRARTSRAGTKFKKEICHG